MKLSQAKQIAKIAAIEAYKAILKEAQVQTSNLIQVVDHCILNMRLKNPSTVNTITTNGETIPVVDFKNQDDFYTFRKNLPGSQKYLQENDIHVIFTKINGKDKEMVSVNDVNSSNSIF